MKLLLKNFLSLNKQLTLLIFGFFMILNVSIIAQTEEPVWGIGTKWTYQFNSDPPNYVTYVVNEITDTVTIDNLLLYKVENYIDNGESPGTGIEYFHYKDGKVYSYKENHIDKEKYLSLLYDFSNETSYQTKYVPICEGDSVVTYDITIDSLTETQMPDGSFRDVQHVQPGPDDKGFIGSPRAIIKNIGFSQGHVHNSHDWEFGITICDQFSEFTSTLRCFENDSIFYQFVDYSCDSTWIISSTDAYEIENQISLYPNPTFDAVSVKNYDQDIPYQIFNTQGLLIDSGVTRNSRIKLPAQGMNIIHLKIQDKAVIRKVVKL